MSEVTVRIPTPLRGFAGGADALQVEGATVAEVLAGLGERYPELTARLLTESGELRSFVNLFVGEHNVRSLQGLETPVDDGAVLAIVPAVAGGLSR